MPRLLMLLTRRFRVQRVNNIGQNGRTLTNSFIRTSKQSTSNFTLRVLANCITITNVTMRYSQGRVVVHMVTSRVGSSRTVLTTYLTRAATRLLHRGSTQLHLARRRSLVSI